MEQDLKGSVVNRAPVEPESRALTEAAAEKRLPYRFATHTGGFFVGTR